MSLIQTSDHEISPIEPVAHEIETKPPQEEFDKVLASLSPHAASALADLGRNDVRVSMATQGDISTVVKQIEDAVHAGHSGDPANLSMVHPDMVGIAQAGLNHTVKNQPQEASHPLHGMVPPELHNQLCGLDYQMPNDSHEPLKSADINQKLEAQRQAAENQDVSQSASMQRDVR